VNTLIDQGAEQLLSPHIWVFYASFLLSFLLTPLMSWVATKLGVTDKPDQARKLHRRAVPYLGGVAIFLGWLAGVSISPWNHAGQRFQWTVQISNAVDHAS
jgi:UDP-GlcNAc:undecaprenyl-phosphate GlcNAc-1-phosphate transferase